MHQLGLNAADVAVLLQKESASWAPRLDVFRSAARNSGLSPEEANQFAMIQYLHEYTTQLLAANNRKIAADLIRLGVLTGSITSNGEPAF
jgi:hypothetical protein